MSLPIQMKHVVPLVIIAVLASGCSSIAPVPSSTADAVVASTTAPAPPTHTAPAPPTPALATTNQPEQTLAWQQVQAVLPPEVPILAPTWLPDSMQQLQPAISPSTHSAELMYGVMYGVEQKNAVVFTMGYPSSPQRESAATKKLTVRGTTASLTKNESATQLRWDEQGHSYAIFIEGLALSESDLLQMAEKLHPLPAATFQTADAWTKTRGVLPADVTIYKPTWLPKGYGPAELVAVTTTRDRVSSYTVLTRASQKDTILFSLGSGYGSWGNFPPPDSQEKVTVLGQEANLMISRENNNTMSVSWTSNRQTYHVRTGGALTRDELLRIANSLVPVPAAPMP